MRVKLTDIYNTRYFYLTFRTDLTYLFHTFLELQKDSSFVYNVGNDLLGTVFNAAKTGAVVEFDLAGAKFTPDTEVTLRTYASQGIILVDSEDSWRDNILRINRERMKINIDDYEELPRYDQRITFKEYIVALDKKKKYKMPAVQPDVYIPLVYMIMVTRPSIEICMGYNCEAFFKFVGSRLSVDDLKNYTEFYFTSPEGTMIVDFSKGNVYIQRIGYTDMTGALTVGTLVPTVLGKQRLLEVECFANIFKDCLRTLNGYRATRKQTIEELLA